MKKIKYIIGIILIGIIVLVGIEIFRNPHNNDENSNIGEIKSGEELLEKADKTIKARGWAGASNNIIGLKDGIMYYYNQSTGEFRKIATEIKDIYYSTENPETISAKKEENAKEIGETPEFVKYE